MFANCRRWSLFQLDVKSTFLNAAWRSMSPNPLEFRLKGVKTRSIGYKRNYMAWSTHQKPEIKWWTHAIRYKFLKCLVEHEIYIKLQDDANLLLMYIYVDDLWITRSNISIIEKFKDLLMLEFEMTDGKLRYFLGLEFVESNKGIILH